MNRWGDGSVCKSESGDRYREASELLRQGRVAERGSEREQLRERQLAAYRARVANRRQGYDPEADRQRRYGAYVGAGAVGGGVAGGYGIRSLIRSNRAPKRVKGTKGLVLRGKTAAQLGAAGAALGGAGYLLRRSSKRENQEWR